MRKFHLHLISDSTGGTVNGVAKACLAQFEDVDPVEHLWHLIRGEKQLDRAIQGIQENPGPVLFTLVDEKLALKLQAICHGLNVPVIPVLQPVIGGLAHYFGQESKAEPGRQHVLDEEYFERIDAMDYALYHDDGQKTGRSLTEADVVLIGVSRTSKTPTCIYLANRGVKAANIPFVPGVPLPEEFQRLEGPLFVGLTESPKRLVEIRANRLQHLGQTGQTDYLDLDKIEEEVREARRFYSKQGWPVIDVTRRSVEETAAEILDLLMRQREEK